MYTMLCAGGSSTRVLEATLHLCAAGLGPETLRVMVIDPDKGNGNITRVKSLLEKYVECEQAFRGKLGVELNLFGTKLDLLDAEAGEKGLKIWTPVQPNDSLKDLLNYDVLGSTATPRDVVHLLFTEEELNEELGQGFRGHPAIGAAALSLLSMHAKNPPWQRLISGIKNEIGQPSGSRVFIVGSVFGGTGASAIHPVARFLRSIPETNADCLKIGVGALVPYFQFVPKPPSPDDPQPTGEPETPRLAAKAEWFALATRAAVEFYHHLLENNDWPFDAFYWVGDSGLMKVKNYESGGPAQKNEAHFVEMLVALAALEFFQIPAANFNDQVGCHYAGPRHDVEPPTKEKNLLDWLDLPLALLKRREVQAKLLRFFLAGAVHLGFGVPLVRKPELDTKPYCVPWYLEQFALRGDSLRSADNGAKLELLTQFFSVYHFPWWLQVLSLEDSSEVRLINKHALHEGHASAADVGLEYLADLLWTDRTEAQKLDPFDSFFTDMVQVRKGSGGALGAPGYLALLAHAADRFIKREYMNLEQMEE